MPKPTQAAPEIDEMFDELDEYGQYCECDLEPIEEELVSWICFACGKEICP